jgi:hypothetical protein
MSNKSFMGSKTNSIVGDLTSWLFGIVVMVIGIINTFWGNDPGFGVFIVLLSFVYFPPVNTLVRKITGFNITLFIKIVLGVFILWASLGVGDLFEKIDLMMKDL